MSAASTTTLPPLPTLDMLDYGRSWDRPLEKAPRPSNAWMLFLKWHSQYVNPRHNARIVSPLWTSATQEIKDHFDALAVEVAKQHELRYPGYVYAPKRRKTKQDRKENALPYPSTSQRARGRGRENIDDQVAGTSSGVEQTTHTLVFDTRRPLLSSNVVNQPGFAHYTVSVAHLPTEYGYPDLPSSTYLSGDEDEDEGLATTDDEEEEPSTTLTAVTETPPPEVLFSEDDIDYLVAVLLGFDLHDWLVLED